MAKYDALKRHLLGQPGDRVRMTFDEIADLVGGLPDSAFRHQAWWANERGGSHVQARAWMNAGFAAEALNQERRLVTFRRLP